MISDTERREVARRLRGIKDTREGCGHEMCCDLWVAIFDSDYRCTGLCDECEVAVLDSLADLIEPSIPADPGEAGLACVDAFIREHTEKPIDRDTPQKAAEEMFGKMRHSTKEEADAYDAMLKSKSVEIHPVDRDALLALADDIDKQTDGSMFDAWLEDGHYIARRIREALRVVE